MVTDPTFHDVLLGEGWLAGWRAPEEDQPEQENLQQQEEAVAGHHLLLQAGQPLHHPPQLTRQLVQPALKQLALHAAGLLPPLHHRNGLARHLQLTVQLVDLFDVLEAELLQEAGAQAHISLQRLDPVGQLLPGGLAALLCLLPAPAGVAVLAVAAASPSHAVAKQRASSFLFVADCLFAERNTSAAADDDSFGSTVVAARDIREPRWLTAAHIAAGASAFQVPTFEVQVRMFGEGSKLVANRRQNVIGGGACRLALVDAAATAASGVTIVTVGVEDDKVGGGGGGGVGLGVAGHPGEAQLDAEHVAESCRG